MARKWYGSIDNRLNENRQFCDKIEVGTGMTEYSWSDSHAYEVTRVKDQKHVWVREYDVKHVGEAFTNNWLLKATRIKRLAGCRPRQHTLYSQASTRRTKQ